MNKSDLKDGMVVRLRNRDVRVIWNNDLYKIYPDKLSSYNDLSNYNDDLKHAYDGNYKNLDIMKVVYDNELIWERNEVDWSKVRVGTKVLYSDDNEKWFKGYYINYIDINTNPHYVLNSDRDLVGDSKYCKLEEEPKEEVTLDGIDKELDSYCVKNNKICNQRCGPCVTEYIFKNYNLTRKDNK